MTSYDQFYTSPVRATFEEPSAVLSKQTVVMPGVARGEQSSARNFPSLTAVRTAQQAQQRPVNPHKYGFEPNFDPDNPFMRDTVTGKPIRVGPSKQKTKQVAVELGGMPSAPHRQAWAGNPTFRFFKRSSYDEEDDLRRNTYGSRGDTYYRPQSVEGWRNMPQRNTRWRKGEW